MPYFASIQYLRGIAALMVLVFHISIIFPNSGWHFAGGETGVDLFFVISGFVMYLSGRELQPGAFVSKRVLRIVPLYWSVTLVVAFISFDGGLNLGLEVPVADLVRSLLFIGYENPGALPRISPIVNQGWSLNLEMMFYAIFSLALAFRPQALLPILVVTIVGLALIGAFVTRDTPILRFYTRPRLLGFVAGLILAKLILDQRLALPRLAAAAMILTGVTIIVSGWFREVSPVLSEIIPAILIVTGVLKFESGLARRPLPFLKLIGDASYSIYLTHVLMIGILVKVFAALPQAPPLLQHALTFCICTLVGILVYVAYERPLGRALSRRFSSGSGDKGKRAEP
jgi:exopolysaccharide production protein ExoZ